MEPKRLSCLIAVLFVTLLLAPLPAASQDKQPLGHDVYDIWRGIDEPLLSRDGAWIAYQITLQDGDPELVVRSTSTDAEHRVPRGGQARFTASSSHAVMLIAPPVQETRQARLDEVPEPERPKARLGVLSLSDGSLRTFDRVRSFEIPEEAGAWVAFLHEKEPEEDAEEAEAEEPAEPEAEPGTEPEPAIEPGAEPQPGETSPDESGEEVEDKEAGTRLVLLDLMTGEQTPFENVTEYAAAIDGGRLAFATSTTDGSGDGVFLVDPAAATATPLLEGAGHYAGLTLDRQGRRVAFLSDRDEYGMQAEGSESEDPGEPGDGERPGDGASSDDEQLAFELWLSTDGAPATEAASAADLADGWWVSEHRAPGFSRDGTRLFFGSAPRPEPEPEEEPKLPEEKVRVDIWHWQDPLLQPNQLLQVEQERQRSYDAVVHLDSDAVVQLADETMPEVQVLRDGDADVALGISTLPYRMQRSWDFPWRSDLYRVDVTSGERRLIRQGQSGPVDISPDGRWLVWWDGERLTWLAADLEDGEPATADLGAMLPHPVHDEDHDWAYEPQPYGVAGWLQVSGEAAADGTSGVEVVIYDRYDLWALDPAGVTAPRQITAGAGRDDELQLRWIDLDPDEYWMPGNELLLSGFDKRDKDAGFWSVEPFATAPPTELVRAPKRFGIPTKAEEADLVVYTREDVVEFPDLWVAGTDFSAPVKVSEVNPQQAEYTWATAELTEWRSIDGEPLQGLIHKPEDFDPSSKYPLMVYFYERNSDNLHQHHPPIPHRSIIRPTFYASRGYVVFTPDITYEVGYPGESALDDVLPGVLHMIDQGYVDPERIGVQGHSWGGYQIAYLVTRTDIFTAAAGGAPVANMVSAYGGIRWGSGLSRMFQYEKTQSRLGGSLWEKPLRYLENSPIFWADKVDTPLLMMHNDQDGAVPWYQGIEMFVALRRLGKEAWLVNYNDEPHWPTTYANKVDWNIRMQQYFDHYLKGEPAPVWLQEGIPATEKGRTLGLELVGTESGQSSR